MNAAPFPVRTALGLVAAALALLLALGWLAGPGGRPQAFVPTQMHAEATGLNGLAAFNRLLAADGWPVSTARDTLALHTAVKQPGLLVLTPPPHFDGRLLDRIVRAHLRHGPVLVIHPKWAASPLPGAQPGWVRLEASNDLSWPGFADDTTLVLGQQKAPTALWADRGMTVSLPAPELVQWGHSTFLDPLVVSREHGYPLAAFWNAPEVQPNRVLFVFEPDLVDNYALARAPNAMMALELVRAATGGQKMPIIFDMTLARAPMPKSLADKALSPPYLAATLCLLLAGLAVVWRGFARFGPPLAEAGGPPPGKRLLTLNAGALLVQTRRWHLLGAPYAEAARARIARALALPHGLAPAETEAAIDRALATRGAADRFSTTAADLAAARTPAALVAQARRLHTLERMLTR